MTRKEPTLPPKCRAALAEAAGLDGDAFRVTRLCDAVSEALADFQLMTTFAKEAPARRLRRRKLFKKLAEEAARLLQTLELVDDNPDSVRAMVLLPELGPKEFNELLHYLRLIRASAENPDTPRSAVKARKGAPADLSRSATLRKLQCVFEDHAVAAVAFDPARLRDFVRAAAVAGRINVSTDDRKLDALLKELSVRR